MRLRNFTPVAGVAGLCMALSASGAVRDTAAFANVASDSTGVVRTMSVTQSYQASQVVIQGTLTPNATYTSSQQGLQRDQAIVIVTTPSGQKHTIQPSTFGGVTVLSLPAPTTATGTWTFRILDTSNDPGQDALWNSIRFTLVDGPPASTELGLIDDATITTPRLRGAVRWFRLDTHPVVFDPEGFLLGFLDIDTVGSHDDVVGNVDIALYDSLGRLVASDASDGAGNNAMLTFGLTHNFARPVPAGSLPRDGRDGFNLPAGPYYLAVASRGTAFGAFGWQAVTSPLLSTGNRVVVNIRSQVHTSRADFNRDGVVNQQDHIDFNQAFLTACP
jgi:hypothetical protein